MNRLVRISECDRKNGPVVRTVEYTYDAWGRRIAKTITSDAGPPQVESYVYDDEDIVLRFEGGRLANRYLHGPLVDQVLADEQVGGAGESVAVLWPLTDRLGSVRDLVEYEATRDLASVVQHTTYDAFGRVTSGAESAVDHIFGFTGRETDAESDLFYYRARYYDPAIGQFISEDPAGFAAGDANLRRYVENDPANRVDPTGLYGDDVHFYFNYYLARYLGLDRPSGWINSRGKPVSEAHVIAYFATRIDYDGTTAPVKGGVAARARFHFPDPGGRSQAVLRNDARVRAALQAVGRAGDVEMFGLLLHVYQDGFAHESYHKTTGHASSILPDQPYVDAARSREMAQFVYGEMVSLLLARRGVKGGVKSPDAKKLLHGKSFAGFWKEIGPVFLKQPGDLSVGSAYQARMGLWEQLIAKNFRQAKPRFQDRQEGLTNALTRRVARLRSTCRIGTPSPTPTGSTGATGSRSGRMVRRRGGLAVPAILSRVVSW